MKKGMSWGGGLMYHPDHPRKHAAEGDLAQLY